MKRALVFLLFSLPVQAFAADAPSPVFNVRAYGAKGDGVALDTAAINQAIAAAHAAGGGTAYIPAGTWMSGSIRMQSNVALYLEQGATLVATSDPAAYDEAEPNQWDKFQDYGHSHFHNSLIWGEGLENISILGPGRIWGKGLVRSQPRGATAGQKQVGNKSIALVRCHNVTLRDFSILSGGWFAILANGVDNLTMSNLKIDTNRDGMDIISCKNVRVSDCSVNSPRDDGICLKSDYALGEPRSLENVTITNSQVSGYDEGTLLDGTFQKKQQYGGAANAGPTGRLKFGTESNGGFKNITISNIVFDYCRGLALETVDGALLEDVSISNVTMRDIFNSPIFLRLGSRMRGPEGRPVGALRRVSLSNFVVYNADPRYASILSGIPGHDIEDVRLNNIRIYYAGGGTKEQAALVPPEAETTYPEPRMFGVIPAYGFFVRHVNGIQFNDVEVSTLKEDLRPAFLLEGVRDAEFLHVKAQHAAGVPVFSLKSVEDFVVQLSPGVADMKLKSAERKQF